MVQNNETCSLCNLCKEDHKSLSTKLIGIADARLYNIRYELDRNVDYNLYLLLRSYRHILKDICNGDNCDFCYGCNIQSILERVKILTVL